MAKHRFFNMYLTTTISVALVLFLIGIEAVLLIAANDLIRQVKQNVALTLVLNDNAEEDELRRIDNLLTIAPFSREHTFISKEQALQEHIEYLGEDPAEFLGFNPLQASYEVFLNADYAQSDSIATIEQTLSAFPAIKRIIYQKDVVSMLDSNVNILSSALLAAALLLLFVAVALIVNTIRLHVYSKRFLINTMQLVGATPHVIKAPIVRRNVLMGFIAGLVALFMLAAAMAYVHYYLNINLMLLTWQNILAVAAVVLLSGVVLTLLASTFATNHYIRMRTDDLYYV